MDSKIQREKLTYEKGFQGSETIRFELETAIKLHLSQET